MSRITTSYVNRSIGNYYLQADLIAKYSSKNIHDLPIIKKLILKLPGRNGRSDLQDYTRSNSNFQIKSFLLLFLISNLLPFIYLTKAEGHKIIRGLNKGEQQKDFLLKLALSNKSVINEFLEKLYMNGGGLLLNSFHKSNIFLTKKNHSTTNSFCMSIPVSTVLDISSFDEFQTAAFNVGDYELILVVVFYGGKLNYFNRSFLLRNLIVS